MGFLSRFRKWIGARPDDGANRNRSDHAARLSLRKFEDRRVLNVAALFTGGNLQIDLSGHSGNNVSVTVDGSHQVLVNGSTVANGAGNLLASSVSSINVNDGSNSNNNIDLSGVTALGGFTHSGGVTVHVTGGSGNDTITTSGFNDVVSVGSGNNTLINSGGTDTFSFTNGFGNDSLSNSSGSPGGTSTIDLSAVTNSINVNIQTDSLSSASGSLSFTASEISSILGGTNSSNTFQGLNATSTWTVNASNDTYSSGSLTISFSGFGTFHGGSGSDSFKGLDATSTWTINSPSDSYSSVTTSVSFSGFETLQGGSGNDTFNFNANSTLSVHGGSGSNSFALGNGITAGSLFGDSGTNTLSAAGGSAGAGSGTITLAGGVFEIAASNAISQKSTLAIDAGAEFDLNGFNQSITGLNLESGSTAGSVVTTGAGTLTLLDDVSLTSTGGGATGASISGNLSLGSATRVFDIASGSAAYDLTISAAISGSTASVGLTKSGVGTLLLEGNNTYLGETDISAGIVALGSSNGLGSTAGVGTVVERGAVLDLNGQTVGAEALTITSTGISGGGVLINSNTTTAASFLGSITLSGDATVGGAGDLTLGGTVNGTTTNSQALTLVGAGAKTFTNVVGGTHDLSVLTQLPSSGTVEFDGNVTVGTGGTTLTGNVVLGGMTLNSGGSIQLGNSSANTLSISTSATIVDATAGAIVLNSTTSAHQNLTLDAQGASGNLTVSSSVTGDAGVSLFLDADQTVTISANVETTGAGAISVSGNTGAGARNILVNSSATVSVVDGNLTFDADQGAGKSGNFIGIDINGATVQSTGIGLISLTGRGGTDGLTSSHSGVSVETGSVVESTSGSITIVGTGGLGLSLDYGVSIQGTIQSTGGSISVTGTAGTDLSSVGLFEAASGTVTTVNQSIALISDSMTYSGTLDAGTTGTVTLKQLTAGTAIDVGGTNSLVAPKKLGITNAELNDVTAGTLVIGDANSGALTVSTDIAPTGVNALHLSSGSTVTGTAGAVTINSLAINSHGNVNFTDTVTTVTNLAILASAGNVTFINSTGLTVGTVDGLAGAAASFGGIALTALNGNLTVANNVSAAGAVTVTVNAANAAFTINSGVDLATTAGGITVSADNMFLSGTLTATSQTVALDQTTSGQLIDLGAASSAGTLGLTNADLGNITASQLNIGNLQSGTITVSSNIDLATPALVTTLSLASGNTVTAASGGISVNSLAVLSSGAATFTSNSTNVSNVAIHATSGDIAFANAGGFNVTKLNGIAGVVADSGGASLTATTGNLTVVASAGSGVHATSAIAINLAGANGLFTIQSSASVQTISGGVTVTADNMNLAGTIQAVVGTETVSLQQTTNGRSIDLGTNDITQLSLSATELNQISASLLTIGNSASGAITVNATVSPSSVSNLLLSSGATVTGTVGGIGITNLAINAQGAVDFTSTASNVANIAISTTTGDVTFVNSHGFTVNVVDGLTGVSTTAGSVNLATVNGNLTVANNVNATTGVTATLNGVNNVFTVNSGVSVGTTSGGMTVIADNMTLNGTLTATGQTVTLATKTNGELINLGGADAAGTLGITNAELNNITASQLDVGNSTSGAITVSSGINLATPPAATTLSLSTGSTVTSTSAGIVVNSLAINSGSTVTVTDGSTNVANLAINTTAGNVVFVNASGLNVATVSGVAGIQAGSGSVTVTATGNLTIGSSNVVKATSAHFQVIDALSIGQFIVQSGANVQTSAGGVTVTADSVDLQGTITATTGTQTVAFLQQTNNLAINLGTVVINQLSFTAAELNQVFSNMLVIGNSSSGAITVSNDVSPANVGVLHLATGSSITGISGGIGVNQLAIDATGDIVMTAATTNVSNLAAHSNTGSIQFQNLGSVNISTVDGVIGLNTAAGTGNIVLGAGGAIDLLQAVNAGSTGVVQVATATGGITQNASGTITASILGLTNAGTGGILLTAANHVGAFAANNSAAGGAVKFTDVTGLTVSTVASISPLFAGAVGVSTSNGDVTLNAGGPIVLGSTMSAGLGTVRMQSSGGISQNSGDTITAATLGLNNAGTGGIALNEVNQVQTISLTNNATGGISLKDSGPLTIGTVTADGSLFVLSKGVSSGDLLHIGGNLSVTATGILTVDQPVTTVGGTGGTISIQGTTLNVNPIAGAGSITLNGGGLDLIINVAQASASSLHYTAPRDIIVNSGATITANSNLQFDSTRDTKLGATVTATNGTITANVGGVFSSTAVMQAGTDIQVTSFGSLGVSNNITATRDILLNSTSADLQVSAPLQAGRNLNLGALSTINASAGLNATGGMIVSSSGTTTLTSAAGITTGAGGLTMTVGQLVTGSNISAASGLVQITGPVVLTNNVVWNTKTSGAGGDLTVFGTIDSTTAGAQNLALTTGVGAINVVGNVGAGAILGNVLITQASNTTFGGSFDANSFQQSTGNVTTFNGAVITNGTIPLSSTDGFQFTGQSLRFAPGISSLDTMGHGIAITANAITLPTTFVNAIGSAVTIQTLAATASIGLEDAAQNLNITSAGLASINSASLIIGQTSNTGGIIIGTDAPVSVRSNITLLTGANLEVDGPFQLATTSTLTADVGNSLILASGARIQSGAGEIQFNIGNQVSFATNALVQSLSGDVTITTGASAPLGNGTLFMATGSTINAGSGAVSLTANGNITLGQVATINNSATAVFIDAKNAGIFNGNGPGTVNIIATGPNALVTLNAMTGVGSQPGAPLVTNVSNLNVGNSSSGLVGATGDVRVNDTNPFGLSIQQVQQQGGGIVAVTSRGSMVVTAPSAGGSGIHAQGGSIFLDAGGALSNLDIRNSIGTNGGSISLLADDNVIVGDASIGATGQITSSGGNIAVIANASGGTPGQILMRDGSVIDAGAGQIQMQAQGDIVVGHIATTNNTSSAVLLASRGGGIVNAGNSAGLNISANSIGALVTMQSAVGIGSNPGFSASPQLQTQISEVSITNGSLGSPLGGGFPTAININEADGLQILQIVQNNQGAVNVTAPAEIDLLSSGAGISATSGNVHLVAAGSNGNVQFDGIVRTFGGNIIIQADQNMTMGAVSSIGSAGGSITIAAAANVVFSNGLGGITMANGAVINSAGGTIHLTADQDIVLGSVTSGTSPGSLVSIASQTGGIVSGKQLLVDDVIAGTLAIRAVAGIGSVSALQTDVGTIALLNGPAGNVQINNNSGVPLIIGTVDGVTGISNIGPVNQNISLTNNSTISVNGPVTNPTGGNILLQTSGGGGADIDASAPLLATGGNGNVTLNAAHNINLVNTGTPSNIRVDGSGLVTLNAQNQVSMGPGTLVVTGTGAIAGIPPLIAKVMTPQLTVLGIENATVEVGRPGERNMVLTVNWGDGTFQTINIANPGPISLQHLYGSNPTKGNPAAPIPITFQLSIDPHILVTAQGKSENSISVTSTTIPPGIGLASYAVNLAPPIAYLNIPEAQRIVENLQQVVVTLFEGSSLHVQMSVTDQLVSNVRHVTVEILSPDGSFLDRIALPETVLDGTMDVIRKLPDGNYRFQLQEPGEERQRLLLEFEVRQGKIVDKNDESFRPPSSTKGKKDAAPENRNLLPGEFEQKGNVEETKGAAILVLPPDLIPHVDAIQEPLVESRNRPIISSIIHPRRIGLDGLRSPPIKPGDEPNELSTR